MGAFVRHYQGPARDSIQYKNEIKHMKKKIEIEIDVCDVCGTEEGVWEHCGVCRKDMCGTCVEEHGLEYSTIYNMNIICICNECEEKAKTEVNPMYVALQKLVDKQTEYKVIASKDSTTDFKNGINRAKLGYGSGYGILPHFEGGVGVSSHERILNNIGLTLDHISDTKSTDVYIIRKQC